MSGCGVACSYCPQLTFAAIQRRTADRPSMSTEIFDQCIATVPVTVDISFAGYAEPWLNPHCTDMVKHAHAKGHGLRIFTTLVGMSPQQLEDVIRVAPKLMVIHLFDNGEYMNERFVSDAYLALLRRLVALDASWVRFLVFGAVHCDIRPVVPAERLVTTRPLISRAGTVSSEIVPVRAKLEGPIVCTEARQYRNVLLPNGDVTLCCMDYGRAHVLGNLTRMSYEQLFSAPTFQLLTRRMAGEDGELICRRCELAAPTHSKPRSMDREAR
jgi:Iron-sulfur cluster-binding domain